MRLRAQRERPLSNQPGAKQIFDQSLQIQGTAVDRRHHAANLVLIEQLEVVDEQLGGGRQSGHRTADLVSDGCEKALLLRIGARAPTARARAAPVEVVSGIGGDQCRQVTPIVRAAHDVSGGFVVGGDHGGFQKPPVASSVPQPNGSLDGDRVNVRYRGENKSVQPGPCRYSPVTDLDGKVAEGVEGARDYTPPASGSPRSSTPTPAMVWSSFGWLGSSSSLRRRRCTVTRTTSFPPASTA